MYSFVVLPAERHVGAIYHVYNPRVVAELYFISRFH